MSDAALEELFDDAAAVGAGADGGAGGGLGYGCVDAVKIVARAGSPACSARLHEAAREAQRRISERCWLAQRAHANAGAAAGAGPAPPPPPRVFLAVCTGGAGRLSRALNFGLGPTPVTHALMPVPAAPGQLSAAEASRAACGGRVACAFGLGEREENAGWPA